jgi:hypothetical protein
MAKTQQIKAPGICKNTAKQKIQAPPNAAHIPSSHILYPPFSGGFAGRPARSHKVDSNHPHLYNVVWVTNTGKEVIRMADCTDSWAQHLIQELEKRLKDVENRLDKLERERARLRGK